MKIGGKMVEESSTKPGAESSTKSGSNARTLISNAKFEAKKFDGTNNFGM